MTSSSLPDPIYVLALSCTIDNLLTLLGEASDYLTLSNHLAALGTLVMFEDHAEDLKAAIRLMNRSLRNQRRQP